MVGAEPTAVRVDAVEDCVATAPGDERIDELVAPSVDVFISEPEPLPVAHVVGQPAVAVDVLAPRSPGPGGVGLEHDALLDGEETVAEHLARLLGVLGCDEVRVRAG